MTKTTPTARLAVDVGGTFTDVVLDDAERRLATKVLTTPQAPERAILEGTGVVLGEAGLKLGDIGIILHGTTLATNAIIERKGARTALIATEGFRDVIEIADESRYDQYDLFIEKPRALVPRRLRFTVPERIDVEGRVRLPPRRGRCRPRGQGAGAAARRGRRRRLPALLHQSRPRAPRRRDAGRHCPDIAVTLSCEVCPEMREYERTSTAIANAYVQPLMAGYLGRLETALRRARLPPRHPSDDLGRQPDELAHRAPSSRSDWWNRDRPAAPSCPPMSRPSAASARCCRSTWAARPPRSA